MKKITIHIQWIMAVLLGIAITSCSSNDDGEQKGIEIPGVTIDNDADCCSAEEALNVYNYLSGLVEIPSLAIEVEGKYKVQVYTKTENLHAGYNDIYFVATKKQTGNYIKYLDVTSITPLMHMQAMDMYHSSPASESSRLVNYDFPAVKRGWVSFVMSSSDTDSWTLSYHVDVLGSTGSVEAAINVSALPDGQVWLKSFKYGSNTYYLSLVNPTDWQTGTNTIQAYVSKKNMPATTPYKLATETFTIDIDPRMPDMGNHTSPNNSPLQLQTDGSYQGTVNLTMTGLWRLHLTVKDAEGNIVAGGEELNTLFWDVTI